MQYSKRITTLLDDNNNSSLLARIGGEEFIVLLPNTTITTALSYAEQLRMTIEETNYLTLIYGVVTT